MPKIICPIDFLKQLMKNLPFCQHRECFKCHTPAFILKFNSLKLIFGIKFCLSIDLKLIHV